MPKLKQGDSVFVASWPLHDGPRVRSGVVTNVQDELVTYVERKTIVQYADLDRCFTTEGDAAAYLANLAKQRIAKLEKIVQQFTPAEQLTVSPAP